MNDPELERDIEILEGQVALARVVPAAHVAVPLDRLERLMKAAVGDGAIKISDERMDELICRARNAATRGVGGGDGTPYRETFSAEAYESTLRTLVEAERSGVT